MASQRWLVNKEDKAVAQTLWKPLSAFFLFSYFLTLLAEEQLQCSHYYAYDPAHVMEA